MILNQFVIRNLYFFVNIMAGGRLPNNKNDAVVIKM